MHVLIGRGTQNYTCDGNATSSKPVANGAVATLFNASCIAANYPDLLSTMPDVALQFPVPSVDDISNSGGGGGGGGSRSPNSGSDAAAAYLGGFHYFTDPTTPVFNLDTTAHDLGVATVKKANATSAPMNALPGSNGRGFGSVPWLKLVSNTTAAAAAAATNTVVYKEVYRLQTAGGQPPETCVGQPASIQVDYAAQYWFYS